MQLTEFTSSPLLLNRNNYFIVVSFKHNSMEASNTIFNSVTIFNTLSRIYFLQKECKKVKWSM